ncbi:MAG: DHH family phosphoesterase [Chloroflexia bacterium]
MPEEPRYDETHFPALDAARRTLQAFVDALPDGPGTLILSHSDADGISAGAILYRALQRAGRPAELLITGKGEHAYTRGTRQELEGRRPCALFVVDLGCKSEPVLPGVPTLFIDHHRPLGVPPDGVLLSSYGWQPVPNSSLLVWWLASAVAPLEDLDWVAAIGTLSDLGDDAPFALLSEAKRRYTAKWLREATTLVNAARRAAAHDTATALQAVLKASHPRDVAAEDREEGARLWAYRREVNEAFAEGKRAAPVFSGDVALVRVKSPCLIHPLVAQVWRTRLPRYIVIVANEGYIPGWVTFSARSSERFNLLDFFRSIDLDLAEGYFGYGHDQASGGSIPVAAWNELLRQLGFGEEVMVRVEEPR